MEIKKLIKRLEARQKQCAEFLTKYEEQLGKIKEDYEEITQLLEMLQAEKEQGKIWGQKT